MNTTTPEIFAVYFPNYHRYPHNDAWYGDGFTEWDLVKRGRPRFEGHHQPKVPDWGYFDESDPVWAAREIDLAADHGITGFFVDWYWYSGVQLMHEQLERGFLKAPNRNRIKFALMWANHPWMNTFPVDLGATTSEMNAWLPMHHCAEDMERVADYCIEHYFLEPNYWKIDGKPYLAIFELARLTQELGSIEALCDLLGNFDARVRAAGLPGMHFAANIAPSGISVTIEGNDPRSLIAKAQQAGFSSVFQYGIAKTQISAERPLNFPIVDYSEVMALHESTWKASEGHALPYCPTISVGYDCSPRWSPEQEIPVPSLTYPYEPMVINNTPERFGELCRKAYATLQKQNSGPRMMLLNAWNEWTEGCYLLPEKRYGTQYLEQIRALGDGLDNLKARFSLVTEPSETVHVKAEEALMPECGNETRLGGLDLRAIQVYEADGGMSAYGSLLHGSVTIFGRGRKLEEGTDYTVDYRWGRIIPGSRPSVAAGELVTIDYAYRLCRIESPQNVNAAKVIAAIPE